MALIVHVWEQDRRETLTLRLEPTTPPAELAPTLTPSSSATSLISLGEPDDLPRVAMPHWIHAILHLLRPLDVVRPAPGVHVDVLGTDGIDLYTSTVCEAGSTSLWVVGGCIPDPAVPERRPWGIAILGRREWPVIEGPD
ncbi:hypothetical protein CKM354_000521900 [Cercospora kikuchii]|uniref:Uncharacterized protein n=1 Tax=Cercospora kikuchii TaxID=84275 RepID=A0A9P3CFS0_9PEZI|nr:uncharacterized protein CKM354_000521900 [Cercospora kikuchii]GIZ41936.1 hypothetical protein CKM354_000521900 [Cercospora kikuchii]